MKLVDFEYDGIRLSDHNFTLCKFDSTNDDQDLGNNINMNNVKGQNSDDYFSHMIHADLTAKHSYGTIIVYKIQRKYTWMKLS